MLNSLRSIVQEVNSARDLDTALQIIVRRVRDEMNTQVCTVYLLDRATNRYLFMATEGLNKEAIGEVSLGLSEGLVGLVGAREEPINLDHAEEHPKYRYFEETGEERFNAFLGVPIMHQGTVLGVLVVQQAERRRFDEGEEAFLVTMSAQLAGVIAHAEATGAINRIGAYGQREQDTRYTGVGGTPGVAIGSAVVMTELADLSSVLERDCEDIDAELAFFRRCLQSVREDIKRLSSKLASRLNREEQALFDVYLRMLDDNALGGEIEAIIRQGMWAQGALSQVVTEHMDNFNAMEDSYLRERATDVKDLGLRVLAYLQESQREEMDFPERTILVGEELTASMLGEVPKENLAGIISVQGSANSHVAILARAMDIPTVMGVVDLPYTRLEGMDVVIDGYKTNVYLNPSPQLRSHYEQICEEEKLLFKGLEALKDAPSVTLDGHSITLFVNTGLMADVVRALERGAEGVGLYRSEVPFLLKERFPSEDEQRMIYREQLEAFAPLPVTMRTLDIGGDKSLPYFPIEEENPFLGWRGIRVTLDHPEIFLVQMRAMLKASEGLNNLRVMLPMIGSVSELDGALHLIHRAYHELLEEGLNIELPPIGVMIEIPAAVYQSRDLLQRVDFLSVGSNDLTQYLLAVDRNNTRVADLYHSFHPAVLAALKFVVDAAHEEGKPVSICGEMAGDPKAAVILMAMGFDILSMNAANLPRVKSVIRGVTAEFANNLLAEIMELDDAQVINSTVELALEKNGVTRLLRPANVN